MESKKKNQENSTKHFYSLNMPKTQKGYNRQQPDHKIANVIMNLCDFNCYKQVKYFRRNSMFPRIWIGKKIISEN